MNVGSRLTILHGKNGAGKSNLLEALYIVNTVHSFRTQETKELIQFGKQLAQLSLSYLDQVDVQHTVQIRIPTAGRRVLQKDGQNKAVTRHKMVCGPMVVFWAHDSKVVSGEPASRRSFLDTEIPSLFTQYGTALESYRRVVEQKNKLLKDERVSHTDKSRQIRIWNEQLVAHGAKIVSERIRFIALIRPILGRQYVVVAGQETSIEMSYVSRCAVREGMDEAAIGQTLERELDENLERELVIGQSIRGPHRDDVLLAVQGKEARDYASEGQVRTLAICLKLAVRDICEQTLGEQPVLLVDDVGSELDPDRRDRAVRLLAEKGQVFMACQDKAAFESTLSDRMDEATIWQIVDGTIVVQ